MGGLHDLIEKAKYADSALKKKLFLGCLASVLFLAAGVLLIRALMGPDVESVPTETEQAASELREQLGSGDSTQTEIEDAVPFTREAQEAPR